jgi:predicted transcriptional regulator
LTEEVLRFLRGHGHFPTERGGRIFLEQQERNIMLITDVRSARQALRVSALQLALKCGINQGRFSYLECSVIKPHAGELRRIEEALERIRLRRLAELTRPQISVTGHAAASCSVVAEA